MQLLPNGCNHYSKRHIDIDTYTATMTL